MYRIIKIFSVLILYSNITSSQFFEYGQDPGNLKWLMTDTEHFRLIYPVDFSDNANKLANTLEKNYAPNSEYLNHYPSKISVIIHNQSVISNGFVALAPRRMEFFTHPDPNYFGQDWLTELAIHEFRHAIQVDKLDQGLTRILSRLTGEQGIGISAAMMPFWFLEGDAVTAETKLSSTGRGRLPEFEMGIKAHLLSSESAFSFSKAYLRSYKHYVPDYYQLGYQMVNYAIKRHGDTHWSNTIDYVARHPYTIFPFFHYSNQATGKGLNGLYHNTMDYLKDHWTHTLSERKVEDIPSLNKRRNDLYINYKQPKFINDSTIVAYKTGLDIVPRFVKIDMDGKEEKIFLPGILNSEKISVRNSRIIWDEFEYDHRWNNRNYSVIKEYDINKGRTRRLTFRTRYTAPEFSITGDTIAVIEATPGYEFFLVLLSATDGEILERIASPDNSWLQDPAWRNDNYGIITIAVDENGKRIMSYDLNLKTWTEVYDTRFINISELFVQGKYLYFNACFDGLDNIYSFDLQDSVLYKESHSKFGAFEPDISGNNSWMVFSDYSNKGYDLKIKRSGSLKSEKFSLPERITEQSFYYVNHNNGKPAGLSVPFDSVYYPEKHYSKIGHFFNFHSWSPFYFDYNDPEIDKPLVSPGITLLSQNHLGTAISSLAYEYRDKTSFFHSSIIYKGLYPVFEFSAVYGGLPFVFGEDEELQNLGTNLNYKLLSYIPLRFNTGNFYTGLQPSAEITYNSSYYYYASSNEYRRGIVFFEPRLYLYSYRRTSHMDLQPDLGITVNLKNINAPFENQLYGSNSSMETAVYLPGIIKNHGLKLRAAWQNQRPDKYIFPVNLLKFPRGYDAMPAISMAKYSGDYVLPLLYPDLSLGQLLYIKRLRSNLFIDYLYAHDIYDRSVEEPRIISQKEYLSEGLELYFDYHLFNFIFEFSSGIRFSYLSAEKKPDYQFLFTVNINKF